MLGPRELLKLVKCSVTGWVDDAAPSMGASLAFYTLFSLAPLLLVMIALAGAVVGAQAAHDMLMGQIGQMAGASAAESIDVVLKAAGADDQSTSAAVIRAITLLLGATTVFVELQVSLNRIWRHQSEKGGSVLRFLKKRLLSFSIVAVAGSLLLASVIATTLLAVMGERWFPASPVVLKLGDLGISFLVVSGLFAVIYKMLPGCRIEWRDVAVGAVVTAVLFWIGKVAISYYIGRAAVGETFGTAGALVGVVAWVYYSAQVFFLGAEFTRQYALRHGSRKFEVAETVSAAP